MCGIAGVVSSSATVAASAVRRMNHAQAHRGPDDSGVYSTHVGQRTLALGHRRLAIQDVSPSGHQPMVNPSTRDVIVYNGEIYNVVELRSELARSGAQFDGRSDTEVLLKAFEQWGVGCLDRLCGMYAFGLYSGAHDKLFLVRDPVGIKPLYFAKTADGFVFASELRAIQASGLIDPRVDQDALASVLAYGAVAAPHTMLQDVRMIEPGHCVEIDLRREDRSRSHVYWRFPEPERLGLLSESAEFATLRERLEVSVSSHLISDVPVGVFLSSGLDSTSIAALAAKARDGDIDTLTVSLAEDPSIDESREAAETAQAIGARHHAVRLGSKEALSLTRQWLAGIDQPTVDGLNTFVISRAVREHGIVVALSGLGGDEMFGGYPSFQSVPRMARLAPIFGLAPAKYRRRLAERLVGGVRGRKAGDLAASPGTVVDLYLRSRRLFADADMVQFGFHEPERSAAGYLPPDVAPERWVSGRDAWSAVRELETKLYMGNMLLRDTDVFGMRHGLEIRVPLLDRRVIDAVLAITPATSGLFGDTKRRWLKGALGRTLPTHVMGLPKRGFALPQARWMRGVLREEFESHLSSLAGSGLLDADAVWAPWKQFIDGQDGAAWSRAWLVATLGAWFEQVRSTDRDASVESDRLERRVLQ